MTAAVDLAPRGPRPLFPCHGHVIHIRVPAVAGPRLAALGLRARFLPAADRGLRRRSGSPPGSSPSHDRRYPSPARPCAGRDDGDGRDAVTLTCRPAGGVPTAGGLVLLVGFEPDPHGDSACRFVPGSRWWPRCWCWPPSRSAPSCRRSPPVAPFSSRPGLVGMGSPPCSRGSPHSRRMCLRRSKRRSAGTCSPRHGCSPRTSPAPSSPASRPTRSSTDSAASRTTRWWTSWSSPAPTASARSTPSAPRSRSSSCPMRPASPRPMLSTGCSPAKSRPSCRNRSAATRTAGSSSTQASAGSTSPGSSRWGSRPPFASGSTGTSASAASSARSSAGT